MLFANVTTGVCQADSFPVKIYVTLADSKLEPSMFIMKIYMIYVFF